MVEMLTLTFDEQVERLLQLGLVDDEAALRAKLETARPAKPAARSVLAVSREVVPVAVAAARVERRGRSVVLGQLSPDDLAMFVPIEAVQIPDPPAYVTTEVDLGAGSRNVRPEDALREILAAGRSPLTLDERSGSQVAAPPSMRAGRSWSGPDGVPASRRADVP